MGTLSLKTAPASEPISRAEAKLWLRVDHTTDDTVIDGLIKAARQHVEEFTHRQLITAVWYYKMDSFPTVIRLPRCPLQSADLAITYYDTAGSLQTLGASNYTILTDRTPGEIHEAYSKSWPSTYSIPEAVTVEFKAGYGTTSTDVPEPIRVALRLLIADMYENREAQTTGPSLSANPTIDRFLWLYRVMEVGAS